MMRISIDLPNDERTEASTKAILVVFATEDPRSISTSLIAVATEEQAIVLLGGLVRAIRQQYDETAVQAALMFSQMLNSDELTPPQEGDAN